MSTTPTDIQLDILMTDWMRNLRQKGSFVHKNTKGAIKRVIEQDEFVSTYALGDLSSRDEVEILKNARLIAQGMVDTMTEEPIKVSLGQNSSFTDGKQICIATDYFDSNMPLGSKIDTLIGFSVHECAHIKFSDFAALAKITNNPKMPDYERKIKHSITNILEDERIEYLLCDEAPGLSDYLATCKKIVFGNYEKKVEKENLQNHDAVTSFVNTFLLAIRYPAALDRNEVIKNFEYLDEARRIITPYPLTSAAMHTAADRIYELIKKIAENEAKKQQEEQNQKNQNGGNQPTQGNGSNSESNNGTSSNNGPSSESIQNGEGNAASRQGDTSRNIQKAIEQALSSQELTRLESLMQEAMTAPNGSNSSKALKDESVNNYINGDADKTLGASGGDVYFNRIDAAKDSYELAKRKINAYVESMRKALKCKTIELDYELRGEKEGLLDTNRLVALKCGNENIFSKTGHTSSDAACICLLIDESGSMRNTERLHSARNTAVLINEAVKKIDNLELFVYGFTSHGKSGLRMNVYAERKFSRKKALGNTTATGGTPTAFAMEEAAKRIRKLTGNKCLMFVITDGKPDNNADVRVQDAALRRKGFIPVGIWITGKAPSGLMKESVTLTDMGRLANDISRIVKRCMKKNIRRHDEN